MPVIRLAPEALAAVFEPAAAAEGAALLLAGGVGVVDEVVGVLLVGAADGGVPLGWAVAGAPVVGAVGLDEGGAWAEAAAAKDNVAPMAARARTFRMCLPLANAPRRNLNRRRLANVPWAYAQASRLFRAGGVCRVAPLIASTTPKDPPPP